ncbi:MAG: hypothetical protein HeimC3_13820 [Candidatus Heimdallarchaeota archaeon LC_3]|nr:MAG: hypothetical protein HeimC3_13820 [Candidatus Heimdallarchaeota archaeon LC_3]
MKILSNINTSQVFVHTNLLKTNQKYLIIISLILLSFFAWIVSYSQFYVSLPIFLSPQIIQSINFTWMWTVMMIAMMLPSIIPMVLLFTTISQSRTNYGFETISTTFFIFGYLGIWSSIGVGLAIINFFLFSIFTIWSTVITGLAFVVAGIYQLTRWKNLCLGHCRSPIHFFMHDWHDGIIGAVRMGSHHGLYCIGCCWGLMLVQISLGMMNPAYMGIIAVFIFIEKIFIVGEKFAKIIGVLFIVLGLIFLVL